MDFTDCLTLAENVTIVFHRVIHLFQKSATQHLFVEKPVWLLDPVKPD
jgi:hypothetical protein